MPTTSPTPLAAATTGSRSVGRIVAVCVAAVGLVAAGAAIAVAVTDDSPATTSASTSSDQNSRDANGNSGSPSVQGSNTQGASSDAGPSSAYDDAPGAEAFCTSFRDGVATMNQYNTPGTTTGDDFADTLNSIGTLFGAVGDAQVVFEKMARTAPDEIQVDMQKVSDAFGSSTDSAASAVGDPIGGTAKLLMASLTAGPSMERVNTYIETHCDLTSYGQPSRQSFAATTTTLRQPRRSGT